MSGGDNEDNRRGSRRTGRPPLRRRPRALLRGGIHTRVLQRLLAGIETERRDPDQLQPDGGAHHAGYQKHTGPGPGRWCSITEATMRSALIQVPSLAAVPSQSHDKHHRRVNHLHTALSGGGVRRGAAI